MAAHRAGAPVRYRGGTEMPQPFLRYLAEATASALQRAARRQDGGALWQINKLCRRGVKRNWDSLGEKAFLEEFLWVVGAIQKPIAQHERYYPAQLRLFRGCSARSIQRHEALIRDQWQSKRRDLNRRMLDAVLVVGCRIAAEGWETFKRSTLPLP